MTYEESLKHYLELYEGNPENAHYAQHIGHAYTMLLDYKKSLEWLERADYLNPNNDWTLGSIGYCYQQFGDYVTALKFHQASFDANPNYLWNIDHVGYCLQQNKRYTEALKYHKKAENIRKKQDKNDTWGLQQMGHCYLMLNEYNEALSYFYPLEKNTPDDKWLLGQMGYVFEMQRETQKAINYLERYTQHAPDEAWGFEHLGNCYLNLKEYQTAVYHYETAYKNIGKVPFSVSFIDDNEVQKRVLYCISECLFYLERFDQALNYMLLYETKYPQETNHKGILGKIYFKMRDVERTFTYLYEYTKAYPYSDFSYFMCLGHVYLCNQNLKDALESYQKSLDLCSDKYIFLEMFDRDYSTLQMFGVMYSDYREIQFKLGL